MDNGHRTIWILLAYGWLLSLLVMAFGGAWLLPDPLAVDLDKALTPPTAAHWTGTDELGRDVLSRVVHAARATVLVTTGATALDIILATVLGFLAAYRGGLADRLLSVVIDLFWSVPFVVFVILVISIIGVSIPSLIITIGCINWVTAARVIRAETTRLRHQSFIQTAEAFGYSPKQIMVQHLLPNVRKTLMVLTVYGAIEILTLETGMAFIGLSLPAPNPTWGGLLANGVTYLASAWWIAGSSAGAVVLTLVSLQLVARTIERTSLTT